MGEADPPSTGRCCGLARGRRWITRSSFGWPCIAEAPIDCRAGPSARVWPWVRTCSSQVKLS